jgi:MinD superfamily P-loop ATPase
MKIAIASGKGGTGKTTLSTNLSALLAESGKTVLVDLDVEEPNSGLFIHGNLIHEQEMSKMVPEWIEDQCTFCGICQKVCNFHAVIQLGPNIMVFPELCHSCYACSELCPTEALPMIPKKMGSLRQYYANGLDFIESRLDIGEEQAVPLIAQTISFVKNHFDSQTTVIFDSPPGTSCPVIEATSKVDFVILITEPTPFGFHDMKLAVETMRQLGKPFGVVINRDGVGNDDVEIYCAEQGIPLLAKIPNSRAIAERYSEGKLLYKEVPEVRQALAQIIQFLNNYSKETKG